MRSRYSAYALRIVPWLVRTTHPEHRSPGLQSELEDWVNEVVWTGLTILRTTQGQAKDKTGKVEFRATYITEGKASELLEHSRFRRHAGDWKYVDGKG